MILGGRGFRCLIWAGGTLLFYHILCPEYVYPCPSHLLYVLLHNNQVLGMQRRVPMHLYMIWRVVLNFLSMHVHRIGWRVAPVLSRCELYRITIQSFVLKTSSLLIHPHITYLPLVLFHRNIGLPFYGRSFAGSGLTSWGQPHSGYADTITWADDEGSPQCKFERALYSHMQNLTLSPSGVSAVISDFTNVCFHS